MRTVAVLSNYRTRNLGNLALTRMVQRLLADAYGPDHIIGLHRLSHPVSDLVSTGDPSVWVRRLEQQLGPLDQLPDPPPSAYGERPPDLASAAIETTTPGLIRRLTVQGAHTGAGVRLRARLDRSGAQAHVGAVLAATDVVWNPAGEFSVQTTPTSRLIDVSVALDRGRHTGLVNFSFEPSEAATDFFRLRGPRLDLVIGRDQRTVDAMVDLGVDTDRVRLAPDAVFLMGTEVLPEVQVKPARTRTGTVGIVLHGGLTSIDAVRWGRVVDHARRAGHEVEIVSSHRSVDGTVIAQLLAETGQEGVTVRDEFLDIGSYVTHLGGLHAVVTGRFHTAVMGLVAGTTVIGVDTYGTKVAGGLTAAGFASSVASGADWPEQAAARIAADPPPEPEVLAAARAQVLDTWVAAFPMSASSSADPPPNRAAGSG